jgi:hypothetical protein
MVHRDARGSSAAADMATQPSLPQRRPTSESGGRRKGKTKRERKVRWRLTAGPHLCVTRAVRKRQ